MMRLFLRVAIPLVALALTFGQGATGATARAKKAHVGSQVNLQAVGPDGIVGRVGGKRGACRAQRHISIYRVNSESSIPSGEFYASTWTHGSGSFSIPGPVSPSEYYVVVDRKGAKGVVCSAATSNSQVWG
jgi:hypothetical protein